MIDTDRGVLLNIFKKTSIDVKIQKNSDRTVAKFYAMSDSIDSAKQEER